MDTIMTIQCTYSGKVFQIEFWLSKDKSLMLVGSVICYNHNAIEKYEMNSTDTKEDLDGSLTFPLSSKNAV